MEEPSRDEPFHDHLQDQSDARLHDRLHGGNAAFARYLARIRLKAATALLVDTSHAGGHVTERSQDILAGLFLVALLLGVLLGGWLMLYILVQKG